MRHFSKVGLVVGIVAVSSALSYMGLASREFQSSHVRWLGYASYGTEVGNVDPRFSPGTSRFEAVVDSSIVIGLRDDGVVVWKSVKESKLGPR